MTNKEGKIALDTYPHRVYNNGDERKEFVIWRNTAVSVRAKYACGLRKGYGYQEGKCGCHSVKKKDRQEKEYKDLIHRLNRIEGQIRGIKGMVEEDRYCTDILIQVAAVNAALNSFNKVLLANHIRSCVVNDIKEGKEETIDELVETLQKVMK